MYSTHNEGKSVVAERFIRTIKSKIYKHMTSISKNVYIDRLDDIVNEYNNAYHTTIKIKPTDVIDNTYINTDEETTIDTSGFVTRTKFTTDTNALDDKIDKIEKKIPDINVLATKWSVTRLITEQEDYTDKVKKKIPDISGLASKADLTAVENKIPDVSGLATASALTAVENKIPDITSLITKTDFDAKLKNISDRVTNNKSKDLLLDNELKKLKTLVDSSAKVKFDKVQKEISFNRGFFHYLQQSYLVYDCKMGSFQFTAGKISTWKSTGIFNYLGTSNMNAAGDSKSVLPEIKNDGRMHVKW